MIGPRYVSGCLPPLLERLMDLDPLEQSSRADANLLRGASLHESVGRSISRLFDTRRHVTLDLAAEGGDLTVLDYGIPDFGVRSPMDSDARFLFGLAIKHAIKAFEPRLKDADVEVVAPVIGGRDLEVIITGTISDGRIAEQVTFRRTSTGKVINGEPDPVE